ncbi:hypothetical protein [uncultured Gammaproteobacteria bacterium]|jgi:hypothetical protein|nr:hypothetical protein [uncultured Gammaproteobacteria bacterium]
MAQTTKQRKEHINFTTEQKLDYAKLMAYENHTNKKIMTISGAGSSAVTRWRKQYLAETNENTSKSGNQSTYLRNNYGTHKWIMKS